MATRDIYETSFDEDVQTNSSTNQCPECNDRVTNNSVETICEDCGLSLMNNESTMALNGELMIRTSESERALY